MLCNAVCVNVMNDSNNCGGCGKPCGGGQFCQGGTCQSGGPVDLGGGGGPLSITTRNFNILVNDTFAVVATGGSGSYSWSVLSGPGSFTAGNTYNAGATPGAATLQVSDGTSTATITATVFASAPVIFSPAGGTISNLTVTVQSAVHCTHTSATWAGQTINPPAFDQYGSLTGPLPPQPDGNYTATMNVSCPGATGMGSANYTVDRTPPSAPLITAPAQDGSLAGPSVQVTGTAEPNSNISLNDNNFGPLGGTQADSAGNWTINTVSMLTGQHLISATARDQAGNNSVASTTILFTVTGGTSGPLQAIPSNSSHPESFSFRMMATGGTPPYTWAPVNMASGGIITSQGAYTAGTTPGTDTVSVTDAASASVQATLQIVAPLSVTITSPANNAQLTQGQPVTVQGHTSPMAQLTLHVDTMQGPAGSADPAGNFNINVPTQLSTGAHTLQVDANLSGNTGSASINVTEVAASGPMLQLTSPANGAAGVANPVTLSGISDPNVNVTVTLDGMAQAPFNSTGSWSLPIGATLAAGPHNWFASGTSAAGNTTTPTFTFTVGASGMMISGTKIDTLTSTTGASSPFPYDLSGLPVQALVPDAMGNYTTYAGSGTPDGHFSIPNVPITGGQFYVLRVGGQRFYTNLTSGMDLGQTRLGRANEQAAPAGTTSTLDLNTLAPFDTDPINGGMYLLCPELAMGGATDTSGIAANATSAPGVVTDWSNQFNPPNLLIDGTQGDTVWAAEYNTTANPAGAYSVLSRFAQLPSFTQPAGANINLPAASLTANTLNKTLNINWTRSAFASAQAGANPNATFASSAWVAGSGPSPQISTMQITNLGSMTDNLATDLTGSFSYGDPFPAAWNEVVQFQVGYNVSYTAPGLNPAPLTLYMLQNETVATVNAGAITPRLGAVTNITINGTNGYTPSNVTASQTNTVSWTPQGSATLFRVQVLQLGNDGGGNTTFNQTGAFITGQTSAKLPPGMLQAGNTYVLRVQAVYDPMGTPSRPQDGMHYPWAMSQAASGQFNAM
jgi:hypothetical protein